METKTILVTGTSRGIGLELVKQYYQAGWKVLACCRLPDKAVELQKLADQAKGKIITYRLDVTDEKNITQLSNTLKAQPIDILFNNAGIFGPFNTTLDTIQAADWLNVFKVNTIAPLLISRAFISQVADSQLKIMANMSSIMGSMGLNTHGGEYIYRSSKSALNSVVRCLSSELKPKGITVVALHPGWVRTGMGGPSGELDVKTSVNGLYKILSSLSLKDSGEFISYNGEKLIW